MLLKEKWWFRLIKGLKLGLKVDIGQCLFIASKLFVFLFHDFPVISMLLLALVYFKLFACNWCKCMAKHGKHMIYFF